MDKTIYVITGPTAVGKTAVSLEWAKRHDAEIVSCDSLLFYCGMDIGTAKPSAEEQALVPHHLIDIVPVCERLDVKAYIDQAQSAVEAIHARGKRVLVVGGSGFYLRSFFAPVVDNVPFSRAVNEAVEKLFELGGLPELLKRLHALNPDGLGELDVQNPRRVIKALERCLVSGETLAVLRQRFEEQQYPFADYVKKFILLERDKDVLWERVCQRTQQMLDAGLVDEVKQLLDQGLLNNSSAASAIGYRETIAFLEAGGSEEALHEKIAINTRRLIAKQRKWFRNQTAPDSVFNLDEHTVFDFA